MYVQILLKNSFEIEASKIHKPKEHFSSFNNKFLLILSEF